MVFNDHEHFEKKRQRNIFEAEEPWMMDTSTATYDDPFVGGGGFNANGFGMMGGMANMMPIQNNIMNMTVQESLQPPTWPDMSYTNRPASPAYPFEKPPSPPLSPSYDPFAPDIEDVEWHPS